MAIKKDMIKKILYSWRIVLIVGIVAEIVSFTGYFPKSIGESIVNIGRFMMIGALLRKLLEPNTNNQQQQNEHMQAHSNEESPGKKISIILLTIGIVVGTGIGFARALFVGIMVPYKSVTLMILSPILISLLLILTCLVYLLRRLSKKTLARNIFYVYLAVLITSIIFGIVNHLYSSTSY